MRTSEIAKRYAKALFEISVDNRTQAKVFADLRELQSAFAKDKTIHDFMVSPLVTAKERVEALNAALTNKGLAKEVFDLLQLLARKGRFAALSDIVNAFEMENDNSNGVSRGTVRSATTLDEASRTRVSQTVEKVLKKKVILTYDVDASVIGGLVAQVGSYTFDDSVSAHQRRMNDELKRRTV
jgi:F-type H+-transporting ATPase subunit delta